MTDLQDMYPDRNTVAKVDSSIGTVELREDPDSNVVSRALEWTAGGRRRVLWINQESSVVHTWGDIEKECIKANVPNVVVRQLKRQAPEDLQDE